MMLICRDDLSVDLLRGFGHTFVMQIARNPITSCCIIEISQGRKEMDTNSFDKQAKQHLKVYENVMFAAKICIVAIIATLVIMAATLV